VRAFVALVLEPAAVAAFAAFAVRLRASRLCPATRLSWTAEAKMHLTLKFLADLDEARVPELAEVLGRLAKDRAAPRLHAKEVTAFPSPKRASVVVVELEDAEGELARLAADSEAAFEALGIPREGRPFRGHLTLARSKSPLDARAWLASAAPPAGESRVTELVLFQSRLSREGSEYTPLARAALLAAGSV
jgi:RNA 2',3'-cyclic 3'-phosphodiesterase